MTDWARDSIFYHIYPLGLCGAPRKNDFKRSQEPRLAQLYPWIEHLCKLGITALYLGPVFESSTHGYDTADYYKVDRRLGENATLVEFVTALHSKGIRVILDGVFHHVGRDFWAFRDVIEHRERSRYCDWFMGLDFSRRSPYGDPFAYEGWNGHYDLVKLNLQHPEVQAHLFGAVKQWFEQFSIDGLRLDVADALDMTFLQNLASFCRTLSPTFWLLGEAVHGDYRRWVNPTMLDSVTNYECYKGLYSSHNDKNFFEIAYSLDREFGEHGIYRDMPLYNFVDNHDVSRVASTLHNPAHLYTIYALLFTIPGVPSIYFGSEWGIGGHKQSDDWQLRPHLTLPKVTQHSPHTGLADAIAQLARVRHQTRALRHGMYRQLFVAHEQFAFARYTKDEYVVVAVNSSGRPARLEINIPVPNGQTFVDLLEPESRLIVQNGRLPIDSMLPYSTRILAQS
jgi:cyclomaltodextrinase / maltogenic alpha-amylase / neopullulanase